MTQSDLPIAGSMVALRRLALRDLEQFHAYRSDPDVARYQGWEAMSRDGAAHFLSDMEQSELLRPGHWSQIGLALPDTDVLVGDLGLHISADQSAAELGITLSQGAQGRSLGLEAVTLACAWLFASTPVAKIAAITMAENARALALLGRTAFVHTHDTFETEEGTPLHEKWFELRRS